jgi:hypothetical protein
MALTMMMALLAASALSSSLLPASLAVTSPYVRPPPRPRAPLSSLLPDADADGQTPQQVRDAARPAGRPEPTILCFQHVFCNSSRLRAQASYSLISETPCFLFFSF